MLITKSRIRKLIYESVSSIILEDIQKLGLDYFSSEERAGEVDKEQKRLEKHSFSSFVSKITNALEKEDLNNYILIAVRTTNKIVVSPAIYSVIAKEDRVYVADRIGESYPGEYKLNQYFSDYIESKSGREKVKQFFNSLMKKTNADLSTVAPQAGDNIAGKTVNEVLPQYKKDFFDIVKKNKEIFDKPLGLIKKSLKYADDYRNKFDENGMPREDTTDILNRASEKEMNNMEKAKKFLTNLWS